MTKFYLFIAMVAVLASSALAGNRKLAGTVWWEAEFDVCEGLVYKNCCRDFDFGEVSPKPFKPEELWPENTECEFDIIDVEPIEYREHPEDKDPKKPFYITKEEAKAYVFNATKIKSEVTLKSTITLELHKYDPKGFNIWQDEDDAFCVCPTPEAAGKPSAADVAQATAASTATSSSGSRDGGDRRARAEIATNVAQASIENGDILPLGDISP